MATPITQVLGFDASSALSTLAKLDTAMATLENRLNTLSVALNRFNGSSNTLPTSLTNIGNAANGATAGVGKLTVSWETLVRVFSTQLLVRAMNAFRDALQDSVEEAIAFQRSIARIQTIANGATFEDVAKGVRAISDNFNIPLLETAAGVYQAVSNQVGNLAESLTFTETAAKFAKATNSSLADSIDLISGAIKSFSLENSSADRVAGIFFTAIDKGRVTATELANTFGRVGPAAAQVGISLEETAGGLAEISIKGVKTSEALTQFRGIITAVTKPTDAMKAKLAEMGHASVESAIAMRGLDGLLGDLANSTHNSTAELAALFPNIRGIGGALALTGNDLKNFARNIELGKNVAKDFNDIKFGEVAKTDAEKVTKAFNEIKNAIVVEFGQSVLAASEQALKATHGVEGFIEVGRTIGPVAIKAALAITGIATALIVARGASIAFAATSPQLLAVTAGFIAAQAAIAAIQFNDRAKVAQAVKGIDELQAANKKAADQFKADEADRLDAARDADKGRIKGSAEATQEVTKDYNRALSVAKSSNEALVSDTQRSLDKIISARQALVTELQRQSDQSREAVKQSAQKISGFTEQKQDIKFQRDTTNLDDATKTFKLIERSGAIARKAEADLLAATKAGDTTAQDVAQRLLEKAQNQLSAAQTVAQSSGNPALETRVFNEQNNLLTKRQGIEREISAIQEKRQVALKKEKAEQEKIVAELRRFAEVIVDNTGLFDKKTGNRFNDKQLLENAKKREAAEKEIAKRAIGSKDFDAKTALGLKDFLKSNQDELTKHPLTIHFEIETAVADIGARLKKAVGDLDLKFPFLKDLEKVTGRNLRDEGGKSIFEGQQQTVNEADQLRRGLAQQAKNQRDIADGRGELRKVLSDIESRQEIRNKALNDAGTNAAQKNAIKSVDDFINRMVTLGDKADITKGDIQKLKSALETAGLPKDKNLQADIELLERAAIGLEKIRGGQENIKDLQLPEDASVRLRELESVIQQFTAPTEQVKSIETASANAAGSFGTVRTELQTSALATSQMRADFEAMALLRLPTPQPAVPGTTQNAAFGGLIQAFSHGGLVKKMRYFDHGGFVPRGSDTVPAMLTPGEMVINASSTSKFFSQLQAINAGRQPVFKSDGGMVHSTTIGDVSINVQGSESNPRQTAREVMAEFNRLHRRGAARLKR
jgi:TP901 family phage tail tape measure protein